MNPILTALCRPLRMAFVAGAGAVLLACGGGFDIAGGVGSGGSGIAEGRVSGFGSIIVDGVEYDDRSAAVQVQGSDGRAAQATAKVGQRVRLTLDTRGKATTVEVLPQLLGPVTGTASGQWLRVVSQWIKVTDGTVLADFTSIQSITAGTELEVHGAWILDADKGHVLEATRLEARAVPADAPVLISGVVRAIRNDGTGDIVVLNREGGTEVRGPRLPAGLTPGQLLSAWVDRPSLAMPQLNASGLRSAEPPAADGQTLVLSGPARDVGNGRVTVQGVTAILPAGASAIPPGQFVQLTLRRVSGGWEVVDVETRVRPEDLGGRVVLKGLVHSIDWNAQPLTVVLRNTPVHIPQDVLGGSNCRPFAGAAPFELAVIAMPGRQPMGAVSMHCAVPPAEPAN